MTEHRINQAVLQYFTTLTHNLDEAIDTHDMEKIIPAQQALSGMIEKLWEHANQENVSGRDKAMLRLLTDMAVKDLPQVIQDPANHVKIQHELRLLKNSLALL